MRPSLVNHRTPCQNDGLDTQQCSHRCSSPVQQISRCRSNRPPLISETCCRKDKIRWGMLYSNPGSGRFEIDQKSVDQHIDELSRQLKDKTENIFAWIRAWNSYAATILHFQLRQTRQLLRPANTWTICSRPTSVSNDTSSPLQQGLRIRMQQAVGAASPLPQTHNRATVPSPRHPRRLLFLPFPTSPDGLKVHNPFPHQSPPDPLHRPRKPSQAPRRLLRSREGSLQGPPGSALSTGATLKSKPSIPASSIRGSDLGPAHLLLVCGIHQSTARSSITTSLPEQITTSL